MNRACAAVAQLAGEDKNKQSRSTRRALCGVCGLCKDSLPDKSLCKSATLTLPDFTIEFLLAKTQTLILLLCAQRLALAAVGGRVDSPSKREKLKAREMLKKRGAYPPSAARIVGGIFGRPDSKP